MQNQGRRDFVKREEYFFVRLLVDEIRIEKKQAIMSGSYGALAQVVSATTSENPAASVPIFTTDWRPRKDSNFPFF